MIRLLGYALVGLTSAWVSSADAAQMCRDCPFPFTITLRCIQDPNGVGLRCQRPAMVRRKVGGGKLMKLSCFDGGSDTPFPLNPRGGDNPFPLRCVTE